MYNPIRRYVVNESPAKKLEIYKKVRGYCIWESINFIDAMKEVLYSRTDWIEEILEYEDPGVNYIEIYKDYSYGRY